MVTCLAIVYTCLASLILGNLETLTSHNYSVVTTAGHGELAFSKLTWQFLKISSIKNLVPYKSSMVLYSSYIVACHVVIDSYHTC